MSTPRNTVSGASRPRHIGRTVCGAVALAVGVLTAACADAPSSPVQPSAAGVPSLAKGGKKGTSRPGEQSTTQAQDSVWPGEVLATPVVASGLQRTQALPAEVSASFLVTKAGGQYTLPGTGLTVWVPSNAISGDTLTMTFTALAGDVVAYHFAPHGTVFSKSLIMVQDLNVTNFRSRASPTFDVGYFGAEADVDLSSKTALILERLQKYFDGDAARLYWAVNHFSGYMVSWGFDRADAF